MTTIAVGFLSGGLDSTSVTAHAKGQCDSRVLRADGFAKVGIPGPALQQA